MTMPRPAPEVCALAYTGESALAPDQPASLAAAARRARAAAPPAAMDQRLRHGALPHRPGVIKHLKYSHRFPLEMHNENS